jgi:hypothetical protein
MHFVDKNDYFVDARIHFVDRRLFPAGHPSAATYFCPQKNIMTIIQNGKNIFTLFCLLLSLVCGRAATVGEQLVRSEYSYRRYTMQDGLPNMLLETVFQDSKGFLWIGTYKGFARFDGVSFTPFLAETAINILHIENDDSGSVRTYT